MTAPHPVPHTLRPFRTRDPATKCTHSPAAQPLTGDSTPPGPAHTTALSHTNTWPRDQMYSQPRSPTTYRRQHPTRVYSHHTPAPMTRDAYTSRSTPNQQTTNDPAPPDRFTFKNHPTRDSTSASTTPFASARTRGHVSLCIPDSEGDPRF